MKVNGLTKFIKRRSPTICVVFSAIAGAAALYFTGRGTVKAVRKYDQLKEEGVEITPKVVVKKLVPCYIPAIGLATTSLALSITGNTIHAKRNRALSLAAVGAAESLRSFKEKAKEVLGEDKVREVEAEQAKEAKAIKTDIHGDPAIRVYDIETGFKIETTYKRLHEAETFVNENLSQSGWTKGTADLRTFYRYLGIDERRIKGVPNHIWDASYMYDNFETNWVKFYHEELSDKDGSMVVMLRYSPQPESEFTIDEYFKEC